MRARAKALAAPVTDPRAFRFQSLRLVREAPPEGMTLLTGPQDVAAIMHALTDDSPVEEFWVFALNTRHRVVSARLVTRGILDASLIHPREVFGGALVEGAAAVIIAHNHPSGDPTPSAEDRAVTRQLAAAGTVVGIPLLDHVIVGIGCHRSLTEDP